MQRQTWSPNLASTGCVQSDRNTLVPTAAEGNHGTVPFQESEGYHWVGHHKSQAPVAFSFCGGLVKKN